MKTFQNPVIPGFYSDPSVCRVNEDYYLVTSTFEYYPGVPIFHSKDLVNWTQIGHVLDRPSQLNLDETPNSKGIYAPTLRYHNGLFYMITTFVVSQLGERRNFYVTAEEPSGPWSDPIWLKGAQGIDPSLFFDEDGRVYYTGNRVPKAGQTHAKHMEIWLQELDLKNGELIGEPIGIWDGALKNAHAQEAPHLYKKDGYYYLLIAEGGTGFTHAVTVARSKSITGPYEANKRNPILTHRHLSKDFPITNVGHADIVETQDGEWWLFCLASRPYGGGMFRNMGRETFLAPMIWEDGWPVMCPDTGRIEEIMSGPSLPREEAVDFQKCDHFDSTELGLEWNMIRTPRSDFYSLKERDGHLRLQLRPETLNEQVSPSFIGRRQQHKSFTVTTLLELDTVQEGEAAGLTLFHTQENHYRFELIQKEKRMIQLVKMENGKVDVVAEEVFDASSIELKVTADLQELHFSFRGSEAGWKLLAENQDGRLLSTDRAGGFVGTYIGMFATSNGQESQNAADFDWFEYKEEKQ
ncbi:arabinofuranosidase [Alkalihalobacillus alcalophilus ATCC 27647 = CGMCC 1.3604]|uniref:Arabinofuranosidase n=1 Tax=Alkalihalobacillus alcalophilus ATCC 27647 = CGMCC 1.3604 TaxID=1218173 RepID=A0A094YV98_ALKAL|nr:glycoside hydrolase family 43 protein [Alkalihalobacillus alcalophilus]KGA97442.1 arabinofuranosidase [Alkalihalobacillus alcalophilus ATCC 27647 = CGMCC 1.3604]MED1562238.1 glycoside hydrolase family 43 protein [Alkalihalobacillus alcalophilus]THG90824.1 arabinofuranosidase [Alkalihalobacillus alcalophilus ATCC 27647 = CGMCC 1.3604]